MRTAVSLRHGKTVITLKNIIADENYEGEKMKANSHDNSEIEKELKMVT